MRTMPMDFDVDVISKAGDRLVGHAYWSATNPFNTVIREPWLIVEVKRFGTAYLDADSLREGKLTLSGTFGALALTRDSASRALVALDRDLSTGAVSGLASAASATEQNETLMFADRKLASMKAGKGQGQACAEILELIVGGGINHGMERAEHVAKQGYYGDPPETPLEKHLARTTAVFKKKCLKRGGR